MNTKLKYILDFVIAFVIAAVVCNTALFLYYRPSGRLYRDSGATSSIWNPYKYMVSGTEGYAFYTADSNGYLNDDLELEDDYIICYGASFTQGKEVEKGYRYSDILNKDLRTDDSKLKVYNVSQEGEYLPSLIKGFKALVTEFDGAKAIILEISSTDFEASKIIDATNQREYKESECGENLYNGLTTKQKISVALKEALPLVSLIRYQINLWETNEASAEENCDISYTEAMTYAMQLIKSEFDGNIIILYHPNVTINEDGTMGIQKEETTDTFAQICEDVGIDFVDASDAFLEAYYEDYSVPYGYDNTTMGSGHLSKEGHDIIATLLLKEIIKLHIDE